MKRLRALTLFVPLLLPALARAEDERPPGDRPAGLVSEPPAGATRAFFVRVTSATLGGNFDSADDEEVEVRALIGERAVRLAWRVLDLPSDEVKALELPGTAWVELPPPPFDLRVEARDEDLTGYELITATEPAVSLTASDFGPAPRPRVLRTSTIRLEEWGLLRARRQVVIEGASLTLELVSAPRHDGKDAESAGLTRAAFGPLLDAPAELKAAAGLELGRRLVAARADALGRAGRSLHTYARGRVATLADQAGALGEDARCLAAADPAALRQRLLPLRGAAPELDALLVEIDAALGKGLPDDATLEAWEQRLAEQGSALMFAGADEQGDELRRALQDGRRGRALRAADIQARWAALRGALTAELQP